MTTAKLRDLLTIDDVARTCGVEIDFVRKYTKSVDQQKSYQVLTLEKKGNRRSGEYRVVFAAKEERLAQLHRGISMVVSNSVVFGDHVQGFVKRRSTRTNAEQHLGAKVILHADIKGFFDAITTEHVRTAFVAYGMKVRMAETLAKACTIDGLLRQGTRCSPTVANLVCFDMDQAFLRLAAANNCVYTRYADDIALSGDSVPADDSIRAILESYGFDLRDDQCFRQHRGRVQFVTGLSVSDSSAARLPKRLKQQLRLVMYYIEKHGLEGHYQWPKTEGSKRSVIWLDGILRYAHSIEPALVTSWRNVLDKAIAERNSRQAT